MSYADTILITGATGLLGSDVLARLIIEQPDARFVVLVRDRARWALTSRGIPGADARVVTIRGDVRSLAADLESANRKRIAQHVTAVIHLAADTTFSRSLAEARAANTQGTRNVLDLVRRRGRDVRFAYISTAFVAGRRTGTIHEDAGSAHAGWVNAYEQSKYEAESLVRESNTDWVILRPSTIVCDSRRGGVTQFNAVHRALRLYRDGLAAMLPGVEGSTVDVVTTDYVGAAIARLALRDDARCRTFQLCAGCGAMPLTDMLDLTYARWACDNAWRRRGISRPALASLETYALFERTVEEAGSSSLKRVARALSHFAPQLALPKRFDTQGADALLGYSAPPVREFWTTMLDDLLATNWGAERNAA